MRSRFLFVAICSIFVFGSMGSNGVAAQNSLRPVVSPTLEAPPAKVSEPDPAVTKPAETVKPTKPQAEPVDKPAVAAPQEAAQASEKKTPEEKAPEEKAPEEKAPEEKAPAKKTLEKKTPAKKAVSRLSSAQLLPGYTRAWVSVPDMNMLEEGFNKTQFGQLAKDEAIEPFIASLKEQFKDWANNKNLRLGVKIENLDQIYSGEICLAGIVPSIAGQEPERGTHGLVLLVDVSDTEEEAKEVLKQINARLVKEGAVQDKVEINGANVTRSKIEKGKRLRASQTTMQTIYDGWLLASDNEKIFRDVMFRLATTKPGTLKPDALAAQPAFKSVMDRSSIAPYGVHLKWFLDPFGYIRLAQALADDEKDSREHRDDWAKILKSQGFDAIQGAGGQVGFMTNDHEVLHRTLVYAPRKNLAKPEQKRVFGLFDFSNSSDKAVAPAAWVPNDVSAFFVGKWNFSSALENVGFLYDAFLDDPGAFERVLQDFKNDPDMQLNIRKLVGQLDSEWTILSATEKPIDGNSERVAIAFKMKSDADGEFVLNSIRRAIGKGRATMIKLGGKIVIEVDSEEEFDDDSLNDIDIFDVPMDDEELEEEEAEEEVFALFDKKYFATQFGHLLVANNKDYMKRILTGKQATKLTEMSDYQRIDKALLELVDDKAFSSRQFGRLDKSLEANYVLLRQGKMENSKTVLAKIVNQMFKEHQQHQEEAEEKVEIKRLDAKDLPDDFEKTIAPYLGLMGWANEVEDAGWRISGCVLKREE